MSNNNNDNDSGRKEQKKELLYKKSNDNDSLNSNLEKNRLLIKKIKHQKSSKHKKFMFIIKILAVLAVVGLGFLTFSIFNKFNNKLELNDIGLTDVDKETEDQLEDITNVVLLGVDNNQVSDAILIVSLNKSAEKINLISIARDSLVKIEPKNKNSFFSKINEAFSNGGVQTTLKTLNKNFNLRLMDYVTINFEGLVDIIDALGGIELQISKEESIAIDGIVNSTKSLKSKHSDKLNGAHGRVLLNGSQGVAFARDRTSKTSTGLQNDFGRNYRQRMLLEAMFAKFMTLNKSNITGLIQKLLPHLKTSLDVSTIFNIYNCLKNHRFAVNQTQIPLPEYTINPDYYYNGKSTVFLDLDYAGKVINSIIYDNVDQDEYLKDNPPNTKHTSAGSYFSQKNNDSNSKSRYESSSKPKYDKNKNNESNSKPKYDKNKKRFN